VRVAEGAAEAVPVCDLGDPQADLRRLKKAGYRIATSSSHRGEPLFSATLGGKLVLVLGGEGEGVSRGIDALADLRLLIPGTGAVESLNVSVACGILLGEVWRRQITG
jgi:RNA methyltransferase, TrmH family